MPSICSKVPGDWTWFELNKICGILNGYAFDSALFHESDGMPLIRIRDLSSTTTEIFFNGSYPSDYVINPGALLVSMDGEFVCKKWHGPVALLNQRVLRLIPNTDQVEPDFLYYWIHFPLKSIEASTTFTTVKHLSSKTVQRIAIPLPPLPEQKRIVAILNEQMAAVEKARAAAEAQLEAAKALPAAYLREVFPKGEPGKAPLPDGWRWVWLGEVCEIARGGSPRPIEAFITSEIDGVNWIRIGDAPQQSKYITSTSQKISLAGAMRSRQVHKGDFILSNSMSFGRPYIMGIDGYIHDGWLLIRDEAEVFDKEYLYYALSSEAAVKQLADSARGAIVRNLNISLVSSVQLPLPPLSEQKRIAAVLNDKLKAASELIESVDSQLSCINALPAAFLLQAFSGAL